ncbi:BPSS1780 family membrane protein [Candidatus Thiothrix anitrata]|jgi:hypothetical protein|uniref:DUF7847 domain-containing protein n=1 Tax=Candidatus Thiothrix anitrata TaxID=2823902 RepID=A0ABX7X3W1_9GAMM|nr:BPSS1780 family membrane protein [Candidatus Thiothrix anitrata]QTR50572.1 hypothetical protein J8380_03105 [Candidatus Thiothrix anitrata]
MNDNNPYSPPRSDVTPPPLPSSSGELLAEPRSLSAGAPFQWLGEGWTLIKANLGLWILIALAWFAIQILMGLVPVLGDIASSLLNPVFMGGIFLGLLTADRGGVLRFDCLFEGFKQKFAPLLGIGALTLGVLFLFMIIMGGLLVGTSFDAIKDGTFDPAQLWGGLSVGLLAVAVIIGILLMMLFWFTTQLIALNDVPVFESLSRSFQGCLRNPLALLVYILAVAVIMLVLLLPPGLLIMAQVSAGGSMALLVVAMLVLFVEMVIIMPWLFGTMYVSYKAIFIK